MFLTWLMFRVLGTTETADAEETMRVMTQMMWMGAGALNVLSWLLFSMSNYCLTPRTQSMTLLRDGEDTHTTILQLEAAT